MLLAGSLQPHPPSRVLHPEPAALPQAPLQLVLPLLLTPVPLISLPSLSQVLSVHSYSELQPIYEKYPLLYSTWIEELWSVHTQSVRNSLASFWIWSKGNDVWRRCGHVITSIKNYALKNLSRFNAMYSISNPRKWYWTRASVKIQNVRPFPLTVNKHWAN